MKLRVKVRVRVCSQTASFLISVLYVVTNVNGENLSKCMSEVTTLVIETWLIICGFWGGVTLDASSATKQQKTMNACFQHFFR